MYVPMTNQCHVCAPLSSARDRAPRLPIKAFMGIDRPARCRRSLNTSPTFTALTGIYFKLFQTIKVTTFTRNRVTGKRSVIKLWQGTVNH